MKQLVILWICLLSSFLSLQAQTLDARGTHFFNSWDSRAAINYNKFISNSEAYILIGVPLALGVYELTQKDYPELGKTVTMIGSLASVYTIQIALKNIVRRQRPFKRYPGYIHNYVRESGYSFPSNHTGGAFALATSLTLRYQKWYITAPAYLWATAVGISRMQLGVHYPSDVIAGAVIGSACAYACHHLQRYITRKWPNKLYPSPQARIVLKTLNP